MQNWTRLSLQRIRAELLLHDLFRCFDVFDLVSTDVSCIPMSSVRRLAHTLKVGMIGLHCELILFLPVAKHYYKTHPGCT